MATSISKNIFKTFADLRFSSPPWTGFITVYAHPRISEIVISYIESFAQN